METMISSRLPFLLTKRLFSLVNQHVNPQSQPTISGGYPIPSAYSEPGNQDMPPASFPYIRYKRAIPRQFISPRLGIAIFVAFVGWGWYMYWQGLKIRIELMREQLQARSYLLPLIQWEKDKEAVEEAARLRQLEARIYEIHQKGTNQSDQYNGDYVPKKTGLPYMHKEQLSVPRIHFCDFCS